MDTLHDTSSTHPVNKCFGSRGMGSARASWRLPASIALVALLSGCASVSPPSASVEPNASDPWESGNRKVFAFNESVDRAVIKPVAEAYVGVVPEPIRNSIGNFFGNLQDAWSAVNWGLQAQFRRGVEQGARFLVNSTAGIAGLFDVGRHIGLNKGPQDFGQTLGVWGFDMGPYVVLPILGPSSIRDAAALPVNTLASGSTYVNGNTGRVALTALEATSQRAAFLAAEPTINSIALDRYTFFRDAYLQRRGGKRSLRDESGFELIAPPPNSAASAASAP